MSSETEALFEDDADFEKACNSFKSNVCSHEDRPKTPMTLVQKSRSEKNRLKALKLKQARLQAHPYGQDKSPGKTVTGEKILRVQEKKVIDSGAGFFIEEEEDGDIVPPKIVSIPAPIMPPDQPNCEDCEAEFSDSYLYRTFDHSVCDKCRNTEKDGEHELITKTDAKNTFLLKDSDFEKGERGDALKFIVRKNPHNPRWGDMKLFLRLQVEKRAMEIWGSEEALEEEHENRATKKEVVKVKKFKKQMKKLRMQVRSSLFQKDLTTHTHEYGEETYDEDKDEYSRVCDGCGHVNTYEKM